MKRDGGAGHDDPELDEILAAFQRRSRPSVAVAALSDLVAEPTPLTSEPSDRDGETFLLPRTRDRQRRLRALTALAALAVLSLTVAAALWFVLRPRAHARSAHSDGTASSGTRTTATAATTGTSSSIAAPAPAPSGSSDRPATRLSPVPPASPSAERDTPGAGRRLPGAPTPGSNLDPEFKRSM